MMLFLTVICDTFTNEKKIAVAVPVTRIEVEAAGSEAMLVLSCSIL